MPNLDTGNTGFMLLCSSLVMLMTPGLAFFYGGLVGRRNVLAIMMQSFVSMGWTTVIWFVCRLLALLLGRRRRDHRQSRHGLPARRRRSTTPSPTPGIPLFVFIAYQMMFAIITPALITGAFANRVTFKAYMVFLTLWLLFVYFPFVHMIWGGGILQKWGVLDFAGGIVVHNIAGMAALASVLYVGRRRVMDGGPHSIPLVALGTGPALVRLVRLQRRQRVPGRFGDRGRLPEHRRRRVLRRHHLAGGRLVAGEAAEVPRPADRRGRRPRHDHAGGRLRLAADRGRSSASSSGVVCYFAVALKNRLHWDDALDVWGVHGVGGVLGIVLLGVFASTAFNPAGADGLLAGNAAFFVQAAGRRRDLVGLGLRLHLRDAVADRPGHAGEGRPGGRGDGPRRGAARRDGLSRQLVRMSAWRARAA